MRVLIGDQWHDSHLDPARDRGEVRIQVAALQNLEALDGLFFVRRASLRTVWNYLREIGPRETARKIVSRRRERGRNLKSLSCGVGRIVDASESGRFTPGQWVAFLAPIGPVCAERMVVPEPLVVATDAPPPVPDDQLWYRATHDEPIEEPWWRGARAWRRHSGAHLSPAAAEVWAKEALELVRRADWASARHLPVDPQAVCETRPARQRATRGKRGVLFGYGNYAKTTLLPNVASDVRVDRIHEIDPSQMHLADERVAWDSSPVPRADDDHDAFFIAGYHHTHAPLATEALRRGAAAVIEKPIATTQGQLDDLLAALRETNGTVFSCFQRRYMRFNEMALEDLGVAPGDAVSYHCIVYEVPLPERHWYRWRNSGSRLLSNGCHWVDHFLFLNDYSEPVAFDVFQAPDATINCSVTLRNGAFFSMVLTDRGSERIGVQDHVELRAGEAAVKIENGSRYQSERGADVVRRKRVNKIEAYRRMYRSIARRIADGAAGDSLRSVELSTQLVLDLEARLREVIAQQNQPARPPLADVA